MLNKLKDILENSDNLSKFCRNENFKDNLSYNSENGKW